MTDSDFAARLRAAVAATSVDGPDPEVAHRVADDVLLEALESLGMHETVKAWLDTHKWYA